MSGRTRLSHLIRTALEAGWRPETATWVDHANKCACPLGLAWVGRNPEGVVALAALTLAEDDRSQYAGALASAWACDELGIAAEGIVHGFDAGPGLIHSAPEGLGRQDREAWRRGARYGRRLRAILVPA